MAQRHDPPRAAADDDDAPANAWAREVLAIVRRLDPLQAQALRLVYFERCTLDDAAEQLATTSSVLVNRVAGALAAFTLALGEPANRLQSSAR